MIHCEAVRLAHHRAALASVRERHLDWKHWRGDIDYAALTEQVRRLGLKPHLVMEQAVEAGSPNTMNLVEARRRSAAYARRLFADLAG